MKSKILKTILFCAGIAGIVLMILKAGSQEIFERLTYSAPIIPLLLLLAFTWESLNTAAWLTLLKGHYKNASFFNIFKAREIGEAFSAATPLGNLGGEPLKAYYLRHHPQLMELSSSIVIDKTVNFTASLIFISIGFLTAIFTIPMPNAVKISGIIFIAFYSVSLFILFYIQKKDITAKLEKIVNLLTGKNIKWAEQIDTFIKTFHTKKKKKIFNAVLIQVSSRFVAAFEILIVSKWVGFDLSYTAAISAAALTAAAKAAFFFIPSQVGISEGAQVTALHAAGMSVPTALTTALIRRIRMIIWTAIWINWLYISEVKRKS